MSINVDDHGDHHPEFPLPAHIAADWVDVADAIDRHHPDVAAEHAANIAADALNRFGDAGDSSGVHPAYLAALRDGHPRRRYRIPIAGTTVSIAVTEPGPGHPPYDACRERESWLQLRQVIADVHAIGGTSILHPGLPRELTIAVWDHHGHRIYVARPGAPTSSIRAARPRARWHAYTGIPALAAFTHKLAHAASATGPVAQMVAAAGAATITFAAPALPPDAGWAPAAAAVQVDAIPAADYYAEPDLQFLMSPDTPSLAPMLPAVEEDTAVDEDEDETGAAAVEGNADPAAAPTPTPATAVVPSAPPSASPQPAEPTTPAAVEAAAPEPATPPTDTKAALPSPARTHPAVRHTDKARRPHGERPHPGHGHGRGHKRGR